MARLRGSGRGRGRPRKEVTLPSLAQARGRPFHAPPRDATVDHEHHEDREHVPRDEEVQPTRQEFDTLMEAVRSIAVAVARLGKKPAEETPPTDSAQDRIPPPPPPIVPTVLQFGAPPAVGQYIVPPPTMPVRAHVPGLGSEQDRVARQGQYERGESSGAQGADSQASQKWDVDRFLKNGGSLFTGGTDPEAAIIWLDDTETVLDHMGCPPELRVRMASGAIRGAGRIWWKSTHSAYLGFRPLDQILWEEFREVFFNQYFSSTVVEEKKIEFLSLVQGDMTVAEYHARFLALERFAPGSFQTERQRAARFVRGLRLSLQPIVSMFHCATLQEAVARALEGEAAHRIHHSRRAMGQTVQPTGRQRRRSQGSDQQGQSQRRRTDDVVTVHAAQGQPAQQAPRQGQASQAGGRQEHPWCQTCQRRHPGQCRRCFTCDEVGHISSQCPHRAPQHQ